MAKQSTLDGWLLAHFADLLKKGSLIVGKINMPIVLYRKTIEQEDNSYEEEVCTLVQDHVIIQVVTSGGDIVPNFNQQLVFTIEKFPDWLLRKSKDLLQESVDLLEEKLR